MTLLVATCPRNLDGEFVAPELAGHQTLYNLFAFGNRLAEAHRAMKIKEER